MRTYHARKEASKQKHKKTTSASFATSTDSDTDSTTASPTKPSFAPSTDTTGFFSTLKSKIYGAPTQVDSEAEQQGEGGEERANETAEAMAGPRNKEGAGGEGEVGEVDELVLVCHGIGQKVSFLLVEDRGNCLGARLTMKQISSRERTNLSTLSTRLINFVRVCCCPAFFAFPAVRVSLLTLRSLPAPKTACTTLSTSPTLSPLLHSQRAQFIPLLWRTDLTFDDSIDESEDSADEHLRNRFSLSDIEVKGDGSVPFLRQVVSGLVLDVPFYLSRHKAMMMRAVVVRLLSLFLVGPWSMLTSLVKTERSQ